MSIHVESNHTPSRPGLRTVKQTLMYFARVRPQRQLGPRAAIFAAVPAAVMLADEGTPGVLAHASLGFAGRCRRPHTRSSACCARTSCAPSWAAHVLLLPFPLPSAFRPHRHLLRRPSLPRPAAPTICHAALAACVPLLPVPVPPTVYSPSPSFGSTPLPSLSLGAGEVQSRGLRARPCGANGWYYTSNRLQTEIGRRETCSNSSEIWPSCGSTRRRR